MYIADLFTLKKIIKRMRIAIEAQRIFRKNKHGMDFVALETIKELQKLDTANEYFIITARGEDCNIINETLNFKIISINCSFYPFWEQIALPFILWKIKPDLLHCTSNTGPVACKQKMIVTLHDVIFLEKRDAPRKSLYQTFGWYYRKLIVPFVLKNCKKIITVSDYEANRINEVTGIDNKMITTVYNGLSKHFIRRENPWSISELYIPDKDFIFFLGNTDPKKNTDNVLRAYAEYVSSATEKPLPLLIADLKREIVDSILLKYNLSNVIDLVYTPGYINNNHLPYIYSAAKIFLYPSLRESFGIPILESMACGTPVITSKRSAMPEIAGVNAILINPDDHYTIAEEICKLLNDSDYYTSKVEYGLERAKHFSWKNAAERLKSIYESME